MVSVEEFEQATRRGTARRKGPTAVTARYEPQTDYVMVGLSTGIAAAFHPNAVEGLETATVQDLDEIEITPSGLGLHFPKLDADMYLPALMDGVFGSKRWAAAKLGAAGGAIKSAQKATAARENGKSGGRPRKDLIQKA